LARQSQRCGNLEARSPSDRSAAHFQVTIAKLRLAMPRGRMGEGNGSIARDKANFALLEPKTSIAGKNKANGPRKRARLNAGRARPDRRNTTNRRLTKAAFLITMCGFENP
jgi:hypothetical protein